MQAGTNTDALGFDAEGMLVDDNTKVRLQEQFRGERIVHLGVIKVCGFGSMSIFDNVRNAGSFSGEEVPFEATLSFLGWWFCIEGGITISGSVGKNGVNHSEDVKIIQKLLNNIPASLGGPTPKLVTDGVIGAKMIEAIEKFQQHQALTISGRIDPHDFALAKLQEIISYFVVDKGQLTFDAEGEEGGTLFHSRKPHVPTDSSGVTIGRGYDISQNNGDVVTDLVKAGLSEQDAKAYAQAGTLTGKKARKFIAENDLVEITLGQQKRLFEITYAKMEADVKRICVKPDVVNEYGTTDWDNLHLKIKDILIDLRYRGDYSPYARTFIRVYAQ